MLGKHYSEEIVLYFFCNAHDLSWPVQFCARQKVWYSSLLRGSPSKNQRIIFGFLSQVSETNSTVNKHRIEICFLQTALAA